MADRLDISNLRETNQIEAKLAKRGLPRSIWKTYSSFANSEGGKILLGVAEDKATRKLSISGVDDSEKLIRDFWNTLNDREKVSINILTDEDISVQSEGDKNIVVINVPAARRENKPVYLGPNPLTGAYRRNADGDYHCTADESRAMLRDSSLAPLDRKIVDEVGLDAICKDTLNTYRKNLAFRRPDHPWNSLPDKDFLLKLNAVDFAKDATLTTTQSFPNRTTLTVPIKNVKKQTADIISVRPTKQQTNSNRTLSGSESRVLKLLAESKRPIKTNEVAQKLGISVSWASKQLKSLDAKGMVSREGTTRSTRYVVRK